jgi:hypothetical protein
MQMNDHYVFLTMTLSGVAVGAVIGAMVMMFWLKKHSGAFRTTHGIPTLLGQWRCQWFDDTDVTGDPKVVDTLEIEKWTVNSEFRGQGHQPQFSLSYPVVGEIDPSRVVTLIYRASRYPFEPNRGVACMELSRDGKTMEGRWFGRRFSNELGGGKVRCTRILEAAA